MASFEEMIFLIQFLIFFVLTMIRFYNVMNKGQTYDMKYVWIFFVSVFLCYGLGLVTSILGFETSLFRVLFNLQTWILGINIVFFIVELFLNMESAASQGNRKAYKPERTQKE